MILFVQGGNEGSRTQEGKRGKDFPLNEVHSFHYYTKLDFLKSKMRLPLTLKNKKENKGIL